MSKGIIMSTPMVQAILRRTKVETRRVATWYRPSALVGHRLWVREAWRTVPMFDHIRPSLLPDDAPIYYEADNLSGLNLGKLRPGMFMPQAFARIQLEVVSVRKERLHDITEEGARAEGIELLPPEEPLMARDYREPEAWFQCLSPSVSAWPYVPEDQLFRESYKTLWDVLNTEDRPERRYEANPEVWVYRFVFVSGCAL